MLLVELKCQICGNRMEVEVLDRQDPDETDRHGFEVTCQRCRSNRIEQVRVIRVVRRR